MKKQSFLSSRRRRTGHLLSLPACYIHSYLKRSIIKGETQKLKTGSERLTYHVRCLMDEFANIGEIPEFPSKLSTMRKYNISATIVLQDNSQLQSMYKDEWRTIMANCDSTIFLGNAEPDTLKYFCEKLGNETVTAQSRGRSYGVNQVPLKITSR